MKGKVFYRKESESRELLTNEKKGLFGAGTSLGQVREQEGFLLCR